MTQNRAKELLERVLDWTYDHDDEFIETLISRIRITDEELEELGFEPSNNN